MDADGSAERRGSACVGVDVTRADKRRRTDTAAACDRRGADMYDPGMGEGQTRPGCRETRGENDERRDDGRVESGEEEGDGGTGDTEGTCYALRDMAEARGIHNFVKTKMLRSCLGGVAFFLVSRNVQACLFPSVLLVPLARLFPLPRSTVPSSSSPRFSLFPPLDMSSLSLSLSVVSLVSSLSELPRCIIPFSFLR